MIAHLRHVWHRLVGDPWDAEPAIAMQEQLDAWRSAQQIAPAMIEEYARWSEQTLVPAEPLVTVCIATYNRASLLLERALPSVLRQSYRNLEVIVIGEHCTDETMERLATMHDPRLRIENLPDRPVYPTDPGRRWMVAGSIAMNRALAISRGDFITHLDDDDCYAPERIERLVTCATTHRSDVVWHPFHSQRADGRWTLNAASRFAYRHVTTSSVMYRSWFARIPWDPQAHLLNEPGDWNRFRRIKFLAQRITRCPQALLWHHRERQNAAL